MLGLSKPVHIFQLGASVEEMVNMTAIAVIDAQEKQKKNLFIRVFFFLQFMHVCYCTEN